MPMQFYVAPDQGPAAKTTEQLTPGEEITLSDALAHHVVTVMRVKTGARLACFDGRGQRFTLTVEQVSKRSLLARVTEVTPPEPVPDQITHLGLSFLKGQAMDRAIQTATEVGAWSLSLVNANRSNVSLSSERLAKKREHWERIIINACEQCGRSFLPALKIYPSWSDFLGQGSGARTYYLEMNAPRIDRSHVSNPASDELTLFVGPEGGWSKEEKGAFLSAQIEPLSIAGTVLRAETAPAVAVALVEHIRQSGG